MISAQLLSLLLAATQPSYKASSSLQLEMSSCDPDSPAELRTIISHNERLDAIDRYGQPILVVKQTAQRKIDGCSEGPSEASVEFEVTSHPRDGSAATPTVRWKTEGEDPTIVEGMDWTLLRATRYGCCGAEDGHSFFKPDDGELVAVASTDPLTLQVINRVEDSGPQGTLTRYAFGLGSTSIAFDNFAEENKGVIAELIFGGPDRKSDHYAVMLKPGIDGETAGPWTVRELKWSGTAMDEQGSTWWIDGAPPKPAQVNGMVLELDLICQCDQPPMHLTVPVRGDTLDASKAKGQGLSMRAR